MQLFFDVDAMSDLKALDTETIASIIRKATPGSLQDPEQVQNVVKAAAQRYTDVESALTGHPPQQTSVASPNGTNSEENKEQSR